MLYFTPPDKNDSFTRIILDGVEYYFKFSYNYMGEFWTLGIFSSDKEPIVADIKITPTFPVNWYFRQYIELPKGILAVKASVEKIGRNDFADDNAKFVYITEEEYNDYMEANGG